MTCIAVMRGLDGKLWMAGDRRLSWDHKYQSLVRPKVSKRNGILVGAAGTSHLCTELVDLFKFPRLTKKDDPFVYAHNKMLPAFMKHLKKKSELSLGSKNPWEDTSMTSLVCINDTVFEFEVREGVPSLEIVDAPIAIGSGGTVATGAILAQGNVDPKEVLSNALHVVAEVKACCDNNIDIIHN